MTTIASLAGAYHALEPNAAFASAGRMITEADILAFAALTGDRHPQHTDADWAARSRFGTRIAHGMLIVSFALGMIAFDPAWIAAVRRLDDVVFKAPVAIGDTIYVEGRVDGSRRVDDELGLVTTRWRVVNQHWRTVVRFRLDVLWRAAAAGGAPEAAR